MAKITSKITSIEQSDTTPTTPNTPDETLDLVNPIEGPISKPTSPAPSSDKTPVRSHATYTPPTSPSSTPQKNVTSDFRWIKTVAALMLIIWLVVTAILCVSVLKLPTAAANYSALQWAGILGMIFGPLLIIFVCLYSFKQLAKLSTHAHTLASVANALTQPDQTVIRKSKTMAAAISTQVDIVDTKLSAALGRLANLEDVLNIQTSSLAQSNIDATQTAEQIAEVLQRQGQALSTITNTFDERMQALSTMVNHHTNNLAEATQLAEQKIKEARISVEGATAKINSASDIVRTNTLQATSTLTAAHTDIASLGEIIGERSVELDTVYKKHANDLTAMIEDLRDEQQNLGVVLEERLSKMRDLSLSAQASAESLVDASEAGKDTIEALAKSATLADTAVTARFREMRDMVQYSNDQAQSISDKAAQRVKNSLELTRIEIGRIERDMTDLQNRISASSHETHTALELVPVESKPADTTANISHKTPPKRRWARLKLKPVQEDIIDIPLIPDEFEAIQDEDISIPMPAEPARSLGTLVADTPTDTVPQPKETVLDLPTRTPELQVDEEDEIVTGDKSPSHPLDLYLEPMEARPTVSAPLETVVEDTIRRAAPVDYEKPKTKSGFSFRSLFGGTQDEPDASLSIVAPAPIPLKNNTASTNQDAASMQSDILRALGQLGLSPNVVVDDGCIIEAANTRAGRSHEAMSKAVASRLHGPVEHMAKALSLDSELSRVAIDFATQYDQSIEALAGNREAIRTQLESEDGRAYLLCDAALNYGRV